LRAISKEKVVSFFEEKVHPGKLAGGFSDLKMTWLLYCAGAATGLKNTSDHCIIHYYKSILFTYTTIIFTFL